ncbi:hypothetical protein [Geopsychrobacter electrodiphilus]|uniref:hypothetical protein n=1 Tax=Geopsychrobacter electrodiphilus TaxID=225196 RepID=UPI000380DF16|nr:hypothetical protein [Geopsychrobacter electrodiphilus]
MKTILKITGEIFVFTGLLLFASQMPALANSTQIIFKVPVSITGFETSSFPSRITVDCYVSRKLSESSIRLLGTSKREVSVNSRSPQRLVQVNVEARKGQEFRRGDVWQCVATTPGIEPLSSTVKAEGVL